MDSTTSSLAPLDEFTRAVAQIVARAGEDADLLRAIAKQMQPLLADIRWLPPSHMAARQDRPEQHLLHLDAQRRFSVIAAVWGPGQGSPIHNHTTWGVIGVIDGAEIATAYNVQPDGSVAPFGPPRRLNVGDIDTVSPLIGDLHTVENAYSDRNSTSIHVYGGDIRAIERSIYRSDGSVNPFRSAGSGLAALVDR